MRRSLSARSPSLPEVVERGAEVVVLGFERGEPPRLVLAAELLLGGLRQGEAPLRVAPRRLGRVAVLQTAGRVLAHGLEHAIPPLDRAVVHDEQ